MSRPRCAATGKVRHASKVEACIAAKRISRVVMDVYVCPKCKSWHVGKTRDPFRNAARIDELLRRHARELAQRQG